MSIETISGKDYLSFFRRLKDRTKEDAGRNRFMTEMSLSMEKETDTQTTVDGVVSSVADGENTMEFTSLAYRDTEAETIEMWKRMRQWFLDDETVEIWNDDIQSGKQNTETQKDEYLVDYFQGKFTSFELSSPADGKVELTYSYTIDGKGIFDHKDILTEEQATAVKAAQYAYHTLAAETEV